jgi:DNA-binding MarR family transcriptional regulator
MNVKDPAEPPGQQLADQLLMASIRLTRTLRALNRSSRLSGPQISLMAVVVYSGRIAARDLAKLEEVTPATISRQVGELEGLGLLLRRRDTRDTRVQWIEATAQGRRLVDALRSLPTGQQATLHEAAQIIEQLTVLMRNSDPKATP